MLTETDIQTLLGIAREAGERILGFYGKPIPVEAKADDSPLTQADLAAHQSITDALRFHFPDIPIISEESVADAYEDRKAWDRFWLVDPLDGTKEFIKKTGYFTVNIGLIDQGRPAFGVVYAPAHALFYFGGPRMGAYKQVDGGEAQSISTQCADTDAAKPLRIVASRDHAGPEVKALLEAHPDAETLSIGSSLKFCLVAEGEADVYLRDVPTMEWDTAAAHAIVDAAGGVILRTATHDDLPYNKESLRNPSLVTCGNADCGLRIAD